MMQNQWASFKNKNKPKKHIYMHVDMDTMNSTAKQVDVNQKTSLHLSPVSPTTTEVKHKEPDVQFHRTSTFLFPSSFREMWSES